MDINSKCEELGVEIFYYGLSFGSVLIENSPTGRAAILVNSRNSATEQQRQIEAQLKKLESVRQEPQRNAAPAPHRDDMILVWDGVDARWQPFGQKIKGEVVNGFVMG